MSFGRAWSSPAWLGMSFGAGWSAMAWVGLSFGMGRDGTAWHGQSVGRAGLSPIWLGMSLGMVGFGKARFGTDRWGLGSRLARRVAVRCCEVWIVAGFGVAAAWLVDWGASRSMPVLLVRQERIPLLRRCRNPASVTLQVPAPERRETGFPTSHGHRSDRLPS